MGRLGDSCAINATQDVDGGISDVCVSSCPSHHAYLVNQIHITTEVASRFSALNFLAAMSLLPNGVIKHVSLKEVIFHLI